MSYLHGPAPLGPGEIERVCSDLVGPVQPLVTLVRDAVAAGDVTCLRLLHEGHTPLHALLNDLLPADYPAVSTDTVRRLGPPFTIGESSGAHALRNLAGLALSLTEEDPSGEYVRTSLLWQSEARSSPVTTEWRPPPDRLPDGDDSLRRQLDLLSAAVKEDRRLAGAAAAVAATLLSLSGRLSAKGPSVGLTVLFDQGTRGMKARLSGAVVSSWPVCLVPDATRMAFFTGDRGFQTSLTRSWSQAGGTLPGTVAWSVEGPDGPVGNIVGESLGAAFAVVVDELRRRHRPFYRMPAVFRLAGANAVVGRIDDWGNLQPVGGYGRKLEAAGRDTRVIVPTPDQQKANEAGTDALIVPAQNWRTAARLARRRDLRPLARWAILPLLMVLTLVTTVLVDRQKLAETRQNMSLSRQTSLWSEKLKERDPVVSGLLAVAAWRFDATAEARYGMLAAIATGAEAVLEWHVGSVLGVAYSPDGSSLATISGDGVRLWDATRRPMAGGQIGVHAYTSYGIAFSPRGDMLATTDNEGFIRLWNVSSRTAVGTPLRHGIQPVQTLAFGRDGATLHTVSWDRSLQVWDVATGRLLARPFTRIQSPTRAAFSPDGGTLATRSRKGDSVQLWDVRTGRLLAELRTGKVHATTFSPDGTMLAVSDNDGVELWSLTAGRPAGRLLKGTPDVTAAAFSADNAMLATSGKGGTIRLWNTVDQQEIGQALRGHTEPVTELVFDPRGGRLVSGSADGTSRLWNLRMLRLAGEPIRRHTRLVSGVAFLPDGRTLASTSWDQTLWLRNGMGGRFHGRAGQLNAMALSRDGRILAVGGNGNLIQLWDVVGRRPIGKPLRGHRDDVLSLAFTPDGSLLVSSGADETVRLWDVAAHRPSGEPLRGHIGYVNAVALSPDGRILASGGTDNSIRLWDVATRRPIGEPLPGHTLGVSNLQFSPAGRILAAAGDEGMVELWDVHTRQPLDEPFTVTGGSGWGLAFSPDGRTLASAGAEGALHLLDVATRRSLAVLDIGRQFLSVAAYSPNGGVLAVGGGDGIIRLWDVAMPADPAAAMCAIAGRSLSEHEWRIYVHSAPYQEICR
ncbi:WD40 repeat domain-containing protein [Nonomuraea sp. NPDC050394]|uniref:WD40 repeat domain-containing protein n=1 Tax=Nonomuraea sp. NPDC050394 TaxID=3364363 RepID=UPI0037AB58C6